VLLLLCAMLCAGPGRAEEAVSPPWSITADRITSNRVPLEINASGKVLLEGPATEDHGPLTIKADSLTYLQEGGILKARGHVALKEESSGLVRAEALQLKLSNRTGRLEDTSITLADQELNFTGSLAEKTGSDSYRIEEGVITSCPTTGGQAPSWSIHCRQARVTIDGMAVLHHASLQVKNIPLLYSPFLIIPAKTTRQSGFLFPEFSQSRRDGTSLITPFFVNLSPSTDLTFYPGYYSFRGPFAGLEFRHLAAADSLVTLQGSYLDDRTSDAGPPGSDEDYRHDGFLRENHDRYWLRGKGDHYFSDRLALRFDLDTVSDQDFIHEYSDSMAGFGQSNLNFLKSFNRGLEDGSLEYRESRLQLAGRTNLNNAGLELRYVDDTLRSYSNLKPVHTLPRLTWNSRLPLADTPLAMAWDAEYLNYLQEEGIGYQRLDLFPRLMSSLPLGPFLEGTVGGGLRETLYRVSTQGDTASAGWTGAISPNRNAWEIDANLATILAREFQPGWRRLQSFTHLFRPNIGYQYLAPGEQNDLPSLDALDRLDAANRFYWQLNNYFQVAGRDRANRPYARQIGHFKLSQYYDLHEAHRQLSGPADQRRAFSDLNLDLELAPAPGTSLRYLTNFDMYGNGATAYLLQARFNKDERHNLQLDYNYVRGTARDLTLNLQFPFTDVLSGRYATTISLLEDHKSYEALSLLYTPRCWALETTFATDSEDRRLMLVFSLTGIGKALEIDQSGL